MEQQEQNPILYGKDTFEINGSHFGVILIQPGRHTELRPYTRFSVTTKDVGPVVVQQGTEENSTVKYEEFNDNLPTGRFFIIQYSHPNYGWALDGKEVVPFFGQKYFCQIDEEDKRSPTYIERSYALRGDEKRFVSLQYGEGGWEGAKRGFFEADNVTEDE